MPQTSPLSPRSAGGTRPQAASQEKQSALIVALYGASVLALVSYLIYGAETQTGPVGYLSALEMRLFGTAETTWTTMVLFFAAVFVGMVVLKAICPKVLEAMARSARPQPEPLRRDVHFTWAKIFTISAIPLVAGLLIGGVSYLVISSQDQRVYALDLSDPSAVFPRHAVFLDVNGLLVCHYLGGYREETDNTKNDHISRLW